MVTLFKQFLQVYEQELSAFISRVESTGYATAVKYLQVGDTEADYGVDFDDYCTYRLQIPSGKLHQADESEESNGPQSFTSVSGVRKTDLYKTL